MTAERRARVWLWLAYQASQEADDVAYAYPRPDDCDERCSALQDRADACAERADQVCPDAQTDLWAWAVGTFASPDGLHCPAPATCMLCDDNGNDEHGNPCSVCMNEADASASHQHGAGSLGEKTL